MKDRIQRIESNNTGRQVWQAVEKGAAKAPASVQRRIQEYQQKRAENRGDKGK